MHPARGEVLAIGRFDIDNDVGNSISGTISLMWNGCPLDL